LVATILAAQAQDERVNQVTRRLFTKYRGPADYLAVPAAELERDVHETGFFRQKAKAIRAASQQILTEFGGEVPNDMDRHATRVAERLRLAGPNTEKTEDALRALYPRKDWVKLTWCLVLHGRRVCRPRPRCWICPVNDLCPYSKKTADPAAPSTRRPTTRGASRGRAR